MNTSSHITEHHKIAARLRKAREDAWLTEREVAKKLKRNELYVEKLEAGERKVDMDLLKELAEIYDKDINYFL